MVNPRHIYSRAVADGLPVGPFAQPLTFWTTPSGKANYHRHRNCSAITYAVRRSLEQVEVLPANMVASRQCKTCCLALPRDLAYYQSWLSDCHTVITELHRNGVSAGLGERMPCTAPDTRPDDDHTVARLCAAARLAHTIVHRRRYGVWNEQVRDVSEHLLAVATTAAAEGTALARARAAADHARIGFNPGEPVIGVLARLHFDQNPDGCGIREEHLVHVDVAFDSTLTHLYAIGPRHRFASMTDAISLPQPVQHGDEHVLATANRVLASMTTTHLTRDNGLAALEIARIIHTPAVTVGA